MKKASIRVNNEDEQGTLYTTGSFVVRCSSRPGVDADNRYRQDVPASNRYEGHEDRVRQHAQRIGHMLQSSGRHSAA